MFILRWEGGRLNAALRTPTRRCTRGGEAGDGLGVVRGVSGAHGEEFEQEEKAYGAVHTHAKAQGGVQVGSRDQAEPSPGEWQSSAGAVQCCVGEAAVLL